MYRELMTARLAGSSPGFQPVAAQGFFSGSTLKSTISGISTGSIIWAMMPSARNSTGTRYFSALSKAKLKMLMASWMEEGA